MKSITQQGRKIVEDIYFNAKSYAKVLGKLLYFIVLPLALLWCCFVFGTEMVSTDELNVWDNPRSEFYNALIKLNKERGTIMYIGITYKCLPGMKDKIIEDARSQAYYFNNRVDDEISNYNNKVTYQLNETFVQKVDVYYVVQADGAEGICFKVRGQALPKDGSKWTQIYLSN